MAPAPHGITTATTSDPKKFTKSIHTPVFYTQSQDPDSPTKQTHSSRKGKEREQFQPNSLPKLSSANLKRLQELSKRHIALANTVEEVPDSVNGSDLGEGPSALDEDAMYQADMNNDLERKIASNPRIRGLRIKLKAALDNARHNPCDGRWEALSHLLRMGVTTGSPRWMNTRPDKEPVEVGDDFPWCNASTEAEWLEWEKRYQHEQSLKKRVAEWTKTIVPVAPEIDPENVTQPSQEIVVGESMAKVSGLSNPLNVSNNSLGFTMAKRTGLASTSRLKAAATSSDIPPPSFRESQLISSTPNDKVNGRDPSVPPSGKPFAVSSSPPSRRIHGKGPPEGSPKGVKSPSQVPMLSLKSPSALRNGLSMSGPQSRLVFPLSPTRVRPEYSASTNHLKRKISGDDGPSKRPRVSEGDVEVEVEVEDITHSTTPKKAGAAYGQMPTLSHLLASAKKTTPKRRKQRLSLHPSPIKSVQVPEEPEPSQIPGLSAIPRRPSPPPAKVVAPRSPTPVDPNLSLDLSPPAQPFDANLDGLPPGDYDVIDFNLNSLDDQDHNPYAAGGIYDDIDLSSPAKSLSSLAGSDTEDDEDDDQDDELPSAPADLSFDPEFASTQKEEQEKLVAASTGRAPRPLSNKPAFFTSSNPFLSSISQQPIGSPGKLSVNSPTKSSSQPTSSAVMYGKYNSQFDVKARVDAVDKILERDLDLEFNDQEEAPATEEKADDFFSGWLRDDEEEVT